MMKENGKKGRTQRKPIISSISTINLFPKEGNISFVFFVSLDPQTYLDLKRKTI